MTETTSIGATPATIGNSTGNAAVAPPPMLPPPVTTALDPTDALGMMMAAMDRMSALSMSQTQRELTMNKELLRERMADFVKKIEEAVAAAKRAAEEEDDGGLLGDIVDCVSSVAGAITGTIADFVKDAVETPFEVAYTAATNPGDMLAALDSLKTQLLEMSQNGETADSVKGFTKGVARFGADLTAFMAKATLAMAEAAATGNSPAEALKNEAEKLWESFDKNILRNPDFWATTALLLKAAAVTGAVMSGGTLAVVALGLMALCEVDKKSNFVEEIAGKDAAKWIRLGMQVGAAVCLNIAAAGSPIGEVLLYAQGAAAIVGGAAKISQGIAEAKEGERQAEALERQAAVKETLNRIHQTQRLIDDLIEVLKEKSENKTRTHELGQQLFQTQATMQSSALMRA